MLHHLGSCHCGNIRFQATLPSSLGTYQPRACDCDFCQKHGAAYVSDPAGEVVFDVADSNLLSTYRQGSGTAGFLLCKACGVVVGVNYNESAAQYAALNARAFADYALFGEGVTVSPKQLSGDDKKKRWSEVWFRKVAFR